MIDRIEIDITYSCNLRCINCNRMCRQAPSREQIDVHQIYQFINESLQQNFKWDHIRVLGGEPTLHPDLNDILQALLCYQQSSTKTNIILFTNNYGNFVRSKLKKIPNPIRLGKSFNGNFDQYQDHLGVIIADHWTKDPSIVNSFTPINKAPIDDPEFPRDMKKGCKQISECGIGLTPYGFYPCSVAGAIDRVFGLDRGIKSFNMQEILKLTEIFCPLCGMAYETSTQLYRTTEEIISKTWKDAFEKYHIQPPNLTRY